MSRDIGGMILSQTLKYSENNLSHSTTNPTGTGLTLAMGLWSDRPWLPAWAIALPVKMLTTIWVCSVNIICDLTHSQVCRCVWLYHRGDILHAWTESVLTPYSIICVKCPGAVCYIWQVVGIHKQLYWQWKEHEGTVTTTEPENTESTITNRQHP